MKPVGQPPREKPTGDDAMDPNKTTKPSQTQGETGGDRSGRGEKGGGQQATQPGEGSAGSQMETRQGGEASKPGPGETGSKAGQQAQSNQATGKAGSETGQASSRKPQQADGKASKSASNQPPQQQQSSGGGESQPSHSQAGPSAGQQPAGGMPGGSGNPTQGGGSGPQDAPGSPEPANPSPSDPVNLDYANKQTDLALDHLKHEMSRNKSDLLDRLGWTNKDAQQFLQQWERLKQEAGRQDERGQTARKELDSALKSLGLRPRGTELQGGKTKRDDLRRLLEDRRSNPPSDWDEQFRAYLKGLNQADQPPGRTSK